VVQVVEGTAYSAEESVTSSSYTAFSVTASITPKFSNSKIYITCHGSCQVYDSGAADARGRLAISSDSGSSFILERDVRIYGYDGTGHVLIVPFSLHVFDTPGSTSTQTYTLYGKNTNGDGIRINDDGLGAGNTTQIVLMEIAQ
jgi:hypothetical protein